MKLKLLHEIHFVAAGSLNCTAFMFLLNSFDGENLAISLATQGQPNKIEILDLAALPKPASNLTWDDAINSVRLECACTSGNCSSDYAKVVLRLFAQPYWRNVGGGDQLNVSCFPTSMPVCVSMLPTMPAGWGARASAVALLYDMPDYVLPAAPPSKTGGVPSPTPSPSSSPTPSPSSSPTPSPSSSPTPAPSPTPMPSSSPSPRPLPSPVPSPSSNPSPRPPPQSKAKPKPPPMAKGKAPPKKETPRAAPARG
ncbi:hypothetical protein VOLCADRAFT_86628 [Volvox carteri f. nagariensis]|uniref:Pherophorin domain-containing protein n=1 Tax=Volvox carteri f. nagariensis TaxID=3068 RepID=D8TJ64_VOLCA|nr:uncharacterized protein VOLCADRAFT_86628 [Volvox carteri f. nagariensis]EFJ52322.1 hypothetical protein VOLCADRAFT_86628 [Volvox carteri f. nagariensis]|eukprot:XP_002946395.1 hypothetical protein VOLCADRAFT_86628 [Volvox carteri f. nagariensis]